jgi:hypothetical protein
MITKPRAYWVSLLGMKEKHNSSKIAIRLPRSQQFNVEQLRGLMQRVASEEPL